MCCIRLAYYVLYTLQIARFSRNVVGTHSTVVLYLDPLGFYARQISFQFIYTAPSTPASGAAVVRGAPASGRSNQRTNNPELRNAQPLQAPKLTNYEYYLLGAFGHNVKTMQRQSPSLRDPWTPDSRSQHLLSPYILRPLVQASAVML